MSLADDIRRKQRDAGEQAVIDNLKKLRLADEEQEENAAGVKGDGAVFANLAEKLTAPEVMIPRLKRLLEDGAVRVPKLTLEEQVDRLAQAVEHNRKILQEVAAIYDDIDATLIRTRDSIQKATGEVETTKALQGQFPSLRIMPKED